MCYCRPEVRTPVCIGCVPFLAKEVQILQARLDRMGQGRDFYEHKTQCLEIEVQILQARLDRIIAAQRKTLDDIATR